MSAFVSDDKGPDDPVRRFSEIPRVDMVVRVGDKLRAVSFGSSYALFRRFDDIGAAGDSIVYFAQAGRSLTARSLGALNVFLSLGKGLKYWRRLNGGVHKYAWREFCAHLGLQFRA